jgi:hypothetical protein
LLIKALTNWVAIWKEFLGKVLIDQEIAKQNLSLKRDVTDLREHLDALDAQLNQSKTAPSPQPSPEDKW